MLTLNIFILFAFVLQVFAAKCPNGAKIYQLGISEEGKKTVIDLHNMYRGMIMNGTVSGQPKGKYLRTMAFDEELAMKTRKRALTCTFNEEKIEDELWHTTAGLNQFWAFSSEKLKEDWATVLEAWWSENKYFKYPNTSTGRTGNYTEMVKARSYIVGCDFIAFDRGLKFDYDRFHSLHICFYLPGSGSLIPYKQA